MASGLVVAAFNSEANTSYFGPHHRGHGALGPRAVLNHAHRRPRPSWARCPTSSGAPPPASTTPPASSEAPSAWPCSAPSSPRPMPPRSSMRSVTLPIPAGPKTEAHQSMAAALAVVKRAPHSVQPYLQQVAFDAFHSGLRTACLAGAVVAALGGLAAWMLLPGRTAPVRRARAPGRGRREHGGRSWLPGRMAAPATSPRFPPEYPQPSVPTALSFFRLRRRRCGDCPDYVDEPKMSDARRTPAMTGLGVRSTAPASSTDSKRSSSSPSTTRASSRASAAPRQK